jgi:hypothetical protein
MTCVKIQLNVVLNFQLASQDIIKTLDQEELISNMEAAIPSFLYQSQSFPPPVDGYRAIAQCCPVLQLQAYVVY